MKGPRTLRMPARAARFAAALGFLCLCLWPAAGAQAASSPSLQELLGAPPQPAVTDRQKTNENPFREPLRRSAPFIDTGEDAPRPAQGFTRGDPPGFAPLPPPYAAAPKAPAAPALSPVPPADAVKKTGGPAASEHLRPAASATANLSDMLGQMILIGFTGFDLPDKSPLAASIRAGRVGGVILFEHSPSGAAKNIESAAQLRLLCARLQQLAPRPLFIAADQEGGRVQRLRPERGFEGGPAAAVLGRGSPDETRRAARRMGLEMAALGINLDFAPVADLNLNPLSPAIGALQRSFGADPRLVSAHVTAFAEGLAAAGVAPCLKHFPGHGSAGADSHDVLPDISASWRSEELTPYREIPSAKLSVAVMPGHLFHRGLDALYPASLSPRILDGLLRTRLGFRGVVITDDLQMDAVARSYSLEERILLAVEAGADMLIFSNNTRAPEVTADRIHAVLSALVRQGRISERRVALSFERISRFKQRFAGWKP